MNVRTLKGAKGITLVALIITIIVLLILATVSIRLVMNDGIIGRAERGTKAYLEAEEKEQIQIGYQKYQMSKYTDQTPSLTVEGASSVNGDETTGWDITFKSNNQYHLDKDGSITGPTNSATNPSEASSFNAEEWDQTAMTEDFFVWDTEDTSKIIGYNAEYIQANISILQAMVQQSGGAITLRFPSRCTKIEPDIVYANDNYSIYSQVVSVINLIELPETVTYLGKFCFTQHSNLSEINIPNSVTSIGEGAFLNCSSLEEVTMGNSVTSIGDDAFENCTSLEKITIPDSVTSIGESAFEHCPSLEKITIPNSVTSIGIRAFMAWTSSQTINIRAASKPEGWDTDWDEGCSAHIVWGYTGD